MKFGIDTLGGARYFREILKIATPDLAFGFFAETFGDSYKFVNALLSKGCTVRVQLCWADDHNYTDLHFRRAAGLVRKYRGLAVAHKGRLFVSPFCEHRLKTPDIYLTKLQALAPEMVLVNSPDGTGALSRKFMNEVHGEDKRTPSTQYIYSYDGTAAVDSDVEAMKAKRAGALIFFMWTYQCNGRANDHDTTPRERRAAWPNNDLLKSLLMLTHPKDPQVNLTKGNLWKSHCEQTDNETLTPNKRACKPVFISPVKVPKIVLIDPVNGKQVVESGPPSPYADGKRQRYYFPDYGYKYGLVQVKAGTKILGIIDGGFRENEYRS